MRVFAPGDKVKFAREPNLHMKANFSRNAEFEIESVSDVPSHLLHLTGHPQWVYTKCGKKFSGYFFDPDATLESPNA